MKPHRCHAPAGEIVGIFLMGALFAVGSFYAWLDRVMNR